MSRFRQTKKQVREILADPQWRGRLAELDNHAPGNLISPLFSLRLDKDEDVRWRAAVAFGLVASRLSDSAMDKARVLMRTFMWYMNEESGNLGWGIPESMAESMVQSEKLAKEFHKILASYIYCDEDCDGNFLDHPDLRRGVYWALGRLAQERPEYVCHATRFLREGLKDEDSHNRGLAAWTLGILKAEEAREDLQALQNDEGRVTIFRNDVVEETTVAALVSEALASLS